MAAALKDVYTREWLSELGEALALAHPPFDGSAFVDEVLAGDWPELELKQRIRRISTTARSRLPAAFREALAVWLEAAPAFRDWPALVFPDLVEVYGLDDWEASVPAMRELTRYSSSELAVRPFLKADLTRMMTHMRRFSGADDEHVRRLASEGCRPRLPWAMRVPALVEDPAPILPILEALRADPSEYVRRSVANNLNDISRDHPALVLGLAGRWIGKREETDRLLKHACRTLLKRGETEALRLFGFASPETVRVRGLAPAQDRLRIGQTLEFSFTLEQSSPEPVRVRLEYRVEYVKARGKTGRKVFKISERDLPPGEHLVTRRQGFADLSTRRHYPGVHRVTVLVNGVDSGDFDFELES